MEATESTEESAPEVSKDKSKEKSKLKFENTLPRQEAVAYLQAIVDSLKSGSLTLTQGAESLEFSPAESVEIEVKATQKGASEKVTFELSWDKDATKLEISSEPQ